jgi:hypothetical protein
MFEGKIIDVLPMGELIIVNIEGKTESFLNKEVVFL